MIHDKRETRLNNRYFFNRYTYWGAEEAYNFLRRNEIKRTFLFLVIKNLISIIFKLKKQQITQDSFEKRELLILIKRFSYYTIIFHFILFKKYRDIMKENWDRDWKSFDYTKMKELNLLWFLNYKLYLNGKNYI
jgi:hypothetical protein